MHSIFFSLIILFLVATLLRMDWVYYLVYVIGGVWLFSHWWIRRAFSHLRVSRSLTQHAFPGEQIDASVTFTNESRVPIPWLHVQDRVPFQLKDIQNYHTVMSVGSHSVAQYEYTLRASKRGYYLVGPLSLDTGDLFGFASTNWAENGTTDVIIYPQIVALETLGLPSRSPFGTQRSQQRLFADPARISGVREYAAGDSLRTIHWKASAREDVLQVKKLDPAISRNVTILLDLNQSAYPISSAVGSSEWAIVIAASVASHLITTQRQQVGLITNGLDSQQEVRSAPLAARTGRGHLMNLLSTLARVQMDDFSQSLADWLPSQLSSMEWGSTLVVVAPDLDERAMWALHNAYRRGSNVTALLVAPDENFLQRKAQSKQLGIHVYRTIWEKDLHAALDTVE